jgi:flagellar assembly protein FliH
MIMKSFLNPVIRGASPDQHAVWNPTEELVPYIPKDEKKVQVLAMFGQEELKSVVNKESKEEEKKLRSVIHSAGTDRAFATWSPGAMDWQPPFVGREAWAFIETSDDVVPVVSEEIVQEEKEPEPLPVEEEFDPEKAAGAILRRARAEADEIILDAQKMADNTILQAQEEIEQQKQDAYQQGLKEAQAEFISALNAMRVMVEEVGEWRKSIMSQGEQILVDMVKDIAQTMFGEGVKLDAQALQINLNRVMESAQGLGDLNVFLNPRDARLLDPSWTEYQLLISGDRVKVIPSENITPGGCFVKGSMGTVDARVETQLAAVIKTFDENKDSNR